MTFFDIVEKICTPPREWPAKIRRWYLFTLPISLPLHILAVVLILIGCCLIIVVLEPALWVHDVWTGKKTEINR